ncbi:MAG: enoyl-CoA hydratase/isomerase family protein [Reyranellaceae bacterium]
MSSLSHTIDADGIALVTLANPPMNALTTAVLEETAGLFQRLTGDPAVRAAVVTGAGRAFSAGLDLKLAPTLDEAGQRRLVAALNDCYGTLYAWPKPLVAAVNGHCIAGGLVLALCGDARLAADLPLQVSLAEVRVGVTFPAAALEVARGELAPAAARRLMLLGEVFDAAAAVALGVFDGLVPAADLAARAHAEALRHAALPAEAFATIKAELRAPRLERIAAARAGLGEPRLDRWFGEEMRRAAAAVLRGGR